MARPRTRRSREAPGTGSPARRAGAPVRAAAAAAAGLLLAAAGCSSAVFFPPPRPVHHPDRVPGRVAYHVANLPSLDDYTLHYWYVIYYRSWDVPTGRVFTREAEAHLAGAFEDLRWAAAPDGPDRDYDFLVTLEMTDYHLRTFRANLAVHASVRDPEGRRIYERTFVHAEGSEPRGNLMPEEAIVGASIRNSTDLALRRVLGEAVAEMREAIRDVAE